MPISRTSFLSGTPLEKECAASIVLHMAKQKGMNRQYLIDSDIIPYMVPILSDRTQQQTEIVACTMRYLVEGNSSVLSQEYVKNLNFVLYRQ